MLTKPTKEEVNKINLSHLYPLLNQGIIKEYGNYMEDEAGIEHYKLLGWISNQYNDTTIIEIGTLSGMGLLALSLNPNNKVVSFDIREYKFKHELPINGIRRIVDKDYMDFIVKSPIIFYDAAHEGKEEREFVNELVKRGWKGILFLDDIYLNKEMKRFWESLKTQFKTECWTDVGHFCGTGVVYFN